MDGYGTKEGTEKAPQRLKPSAVDGMRRLATGWAAPLVGAFLAVVVLNALLPETLVPVVRFVIFGFAWLPLAALWVAWGSSLISIAIWLVPAVSLSVVWILGGGRAIEFAITGINIAIIGVSLFPPASERWAVFVSRLATTLLRRSLSRDDREVDLMAERVRRRLWVASNEARQSGPGRFASDLLGLRKAAEDLPLDEVGHAQLRRALLGFIDALYDQVTGIGTGVSGSGEAGKALENYWRELHRYRSRSFLYRIMTLQRKAD